MHPSSWLLLGWFCLGSVVSEQGPILALKLMIPLLWMAALMVHEIGHAWATRHFDQERGPLVLYPFGTASPSALPHPGEEIWVALAGPGLNLMVAAASLAGLHFRPELDPTGLAWQFALLNLGLGLINLLPFSLFDGARVLAAISTIAGEDAGRWTPRLSSYKRLLAWLAGLTGMGLASFPLLLLGLFLLISSNSDARLQEPPPSSRVQILPPGSYSPDDPRVVEV